MSATIDKFHAFRDVCLFLKGQDMTPSAHEHISGVITLTPENIDKILYADKLDLILSGCVHFKSDSLELSQFGRKLATIGAVVKLTIIVPQHAYLCWNELLKNQKNRLEIPNLFMIISDEYRIFTCSDDHEFVNAYRNIVKFIVYLKDAAEHEFSSTSLVYLGRSKLTINIYYGQSSLEGLNTLGFDTFIKTMQSAEHSLQKKYLFQDTLFNMLLQIDTDFRFESLLKRLQEFFIQFEHSYRLFVTSFSFDTVRREYEEKYREYNSKLNSSINEVATKALATPIALLFSVSNITTTSTAISNYAIAISSILVSTFIIFLVKSNSDNLLAIKNEYCNLFDRLSSEISVENSEDAGLKKDIKELKRKLDKRVTASEDLNKLTTISALASSIFVIGYLFWIA